MPEVGRKAFCFEGYTLDLRRGCLRAADREIELRPKSFAVLRYLVENAGRLVSKDELVKAVWPNVIVTDDSLARCVSDVRQALNDADQRIIKTVPRRGYLLAVVVSEPAQSGSAQPTPPDAESIEHMDRGGARVARRSAERRQLTVMSCELVGLAALSTRLDPEDLRTATAECHRQCREIIHQHHGFVAHSLGDQLVGYFGYPEADEHDGENAVAAGLALVESTSRLARICGADIQLRIGTASGLVVIGEELDAGGTMERTAVGETPNLAGRLQSAAAPGTVVVADITRRLAGGLFEYRSLGLLTLEGLPQPVQAWEVVGPSAVEDRFQALRSGDTPLVNREEEMVLLTRRWEQAKAGYGCVVLISGEPGIGKSRLTVALEERGQSGSHTMLQFFCSPHHSDSALYPVIAQLARAAGFERHDTPEVKLDKLALLLGPASIDESASQLIAELLSVPTGIRFAPLNWSPQRKKERTLEALLGRLEHLARERPVFAIFEDVHWIDPSSRELLDMTVERVMRLPMLLVITFRPEFQPPWIGQSHVTSLSLSRFGQRDGEALVGHIAGDNQLPGGVVAEITRRSDGVPLFVEELTKAVLEIGVDGDDAMRTLATTPPQSFAVPATLHASLMARLDHLGPVAKEIAQIGASIGREFSYELLTSVAQKGAGQLNAALAGLIGAGVVSIRGTPPHATFLFKHALLRDAAYGSLLRDRRQELHAGIARALEGEFTTVAEVQPEILAHHFTAAGMAEKAIAYWQKAGERSKARSAMAEAITQIRKALDLLRSLPDTPDRQSAEIELQLALGGALIAAKGLATRDVVEVYARARELSERVGAVTQFFRVLWGQWLNCSSRAEYGAAHDLAQQCLRVAESAGDPVLLIEAHHALGAGYCGAGKFTEAVRHLEQALARYDPARHGSCAYTYGQDPGVVCLIFTGFALWFLGYPEQAQKRTEEGLALARKLSHPVTSATAAAFAALVQQLCRNAQAVEPLAGLAVDLSAKHGIAYMSAMGTILGGWTITQRDQIETGIAQMSLGVEALRATDAVALMGYFSLLLAEAHAAAGRPEEGLRVLAAVDVTRAQCFASELSRLRGELLLKAGDGSRAVQDQVEECFHQALTISREQRAKSMELRASMSLSRLMVHQSRRADARKALAGVFSSFTEGFDTPDLRDARKLMEELAE
jgi:class 3 adenylate cyclase/predicted ATPase